MTAEEIEKVLNEDLKVNSLGHIRGKNTANNKIMSLHLKSIDSDLMDVRIFVAKLSTGLSTKEALNEIDHFIYKKQIS